MDPFEGCPVCAEYASNVVSISCLMDVDCHTVFVTVDPGGTKCSLGEGFDDSKY